MEVNSQPVLVGTPLHSKDKGNFKEPQPPPAIAKPKAPQQPHTPPPAARSEAPRSGPPPPPLPSRAQKRCAPKANTPPASECRKLIREDHRPASEASSSIDLDMDTDSTPGDNRASSSSSIAASTRSCAKENSRPQGLDLGNFNRPPSAPQLVCEDSAKTPHPPQTPVHELSLPSSSASSATPTKMTFHTLNESLPTYKTICLVPPPMQLSSTIAPFPPSATTTYINKYESSQKLAEHLDKQLEPYGGSSKLMTIVFDKKFTVPPTHILALSSPSYVSTLLDMSRLATGNLFVEILCLDKHSLDKIAWSVLISKFKVPQVPLFLSSTPEILESLTRHGALTHQHGNFPFRLDHVSSNPP